jgi:hypothetical protein
MYYDTSQQKNTARCNDKGEINVTLTWSVHWSTKLCRFCRVKLIHNLTGYEYSLCMKAVIAYYCVQRSNRKCTNHR